MLNDRASNITVHRVLSGDHTEVCAWLVRELSERGLWTEDMRMSILRNHGASVTARAL